MRKATDFTGSLIGNTILGYLILTIVFMIIIASVMNEYIWMIIWYYRISIIILVIPEIIKILLFFFIKTFVMRKIIYNRNLAQFFDLLILIITIIEGLALSFTRFIIGLIYLIIGLARFDESVMPDWANKIIQLDSVTNAFNSTIYMHHYFYNPIFISCSDWIKTQNKTKKCRGVKILWISFVKILIPKIMIQRKKKY